MTGLTAGGTVRALEAAGLDVPDVVRAVRAALDEDFRYGPDVTSAATVAGRTVTADVVAREAGVVAGLPVALAVLDLLGGLPGGGGLEPGRGPGGTRPGGAGDGRAVTGAALVADGARVRAGDAVLRVSGDAVAVLGAERTMLNFLTHLSGIATATRAWADAVAGTGAVVRDTRKTLPGLRALEKYAVRCGGGREPPDGARRRGPRQGQPRRGGGRGGGGGARGARGGAAGAGDRGRVRLRRPGPRGARGGGAVHPARQHAGARSCARPWRWRAAYDGVRLEASGGLRLGNAREVAATGVDYLAVGGLTHSSRALDLGLDYRGGEG